MQEQTSKIQNIFRILLGAFMLYAGVGHAQVPTWITTDKSFMDFIVFVSGVVEIVFGVFMVRGGKLKEKTGIALAIFFILVFPGNINQYVHKIDAFGLNTDTKRLIRLFFQPVLVVWALWSVSGIKYLKNKKKLL